MAQSNVGTVVLEGSGPWPTVVLKAEQPVGPAWLIDVERPPWEQWPEHTIIQHTYPTPPPFGLPPKNMLAGVQ